ncbi:sulfite reductase [ferredoxin] [Candidatus Phycosocius bacilliformis]|uniref:Sulfite reductase [ferredoxin] n=1 Tax=Candidatus Phycosocius bacilliformis TaxID=1445552 RepID=A0A2P2ED17_9PROT|nr:nitrite/sulfite reductase [Candidatus Phycosocius bacilliformis]GBF58944.1 sulfite reductase [ferredoxin] [Candidatus Phycosocius bacilliformis]
MYIYNDIDQSIVDARVRQFADQTDRYLSGRLSEDEYKPLRLQNGVYVERHSPLLRIAIPYGLLSSRQLRMLAQIGRVYDRNFGHFTTRQNIQFNWVRLEDVPNILGDLATVQMHAIQTSGSCIRNVTTDHLAGVAHDERVDPRPLAELMRQWSTLNPEFAFLPRKFKVAFNGAVEDRAASEVHDLAFEVYCDEAGEVRLIVKVGGGQGRTPRVAPVIKTGLHWRDMLSYTEAVLRTYNRWGRRDNIYKSRIKILVDALGAERFSAEVEQEFTHLVGGPATLPAGELDRMTAFFAPPAYVTTPSWDQEEARHRLADPRFNAWVKRNVARHKRDNYGAVTISLKSPGIAPGDATSDQMDAIADLADRYSFGQIRVSHHQNLVLADVARSDLWALYQALEALKLGEPNVGLATDVICCPGGDYCALANAKSIPVAAAVQDALAPKAQDIGTLAIKMSGCINACGHHHVGHIGILGVDKKDEEWYQILIGGRTDTRTALGQIIGKAIPRDEVAPTVSRLTDFYLNQRQPGEIFVDAVERLGKAAFLAAAFPSEPAPASPDLKLKENV